MGAQREFGRSEQYSKEVDETSSSEEVNIGDIRYRVREQRGKSEEEKSIKSEIREASLRLASSIDGSISDSNKHEKLLSFLEDAFNEPYPSLVPFLIFVICLVAFLAGLIANSYLVFLNQIEVGEIEGLQEMIQVLAKRLSLIQCIYRSTAFILATDTGTIDGESFTQYDLGHFRSSERKQLESCLGSFYEESIEFFEKISTFDESKQMSAEC